MFLSMMFPALPNPFLQVKLLRLLRLLGAGDVQASEQMSDILAQIPPTLTPPKLLVVQSYTKPFRLFLALKLILVCVCSVSTFSVNS